MLSLSEVYSNVTLEKFVCRDTISRISRSFMFLHSSKFYLFSSFFFYASAHHLSSSTSFFFFRHIFRIFFIALHRYLTRKGEEKIERKKRRRKETPSYKGTSTRVRSTHCQHKIAGETVAEILVTRTRDGGRGGDVIPRAPITTPDEYRDADKGMTPICSVLDSARKRGCRPLIPQVGFF